VAVQSATKLTLKHIIAMNVRALLRHQHLGRDVCTGFIGDRGEGKSIGAGGIALRDYMIQGEPVWSNMAIKCTVNVSDEDAAPYGLDGGKVVYESIELDKPALLRFDPQFQDGCIVIDEPNMEFAEARRSNTNTNLFFDRVGQQLRKYRSALLYTVVHEMWIDNRLRTLTDIFIRTRDTALDPDNLRKKVPPGINFEWNIYPMTRKLLGITYADMGKPLPPIPMNFKKMWGIIDTYQKQAEGKTKYGLDFKASSVEVELTESPAVVQEKKDWGWLREVVDALVADGRPVVPATVAYEHPEVRKRRMAPPVIAKEIGIHYNLYTKPMWVDGRMRRGFEIPDELLVPV